MIVRKVNETGLYEFGKLDLNTAEVVPSYKEETIVFNFTGERITFINSEGSAYTLKPEQNADFDGKIIIRKEIKWSHGSRWVKQLSNNHTVDSRIVELLEKCYAEANKKDNLIKNGGHHTCRYDIVLDLPDKHNGYNAFTLSHPNITIGHMNGGRSLEMLHEKKFADTGPADLNAGTSSTIGYVVSEEEVAEGGGVIHVLSMFIRVKRITCSYRSPGSLVCLVTGTTLHDAKTQETADDVLELHDDVAEAIENIALELKETYRERDTHIKHTLIDNAQVEAEEKIRADKHNLNLELHGLKRSAIITDMASTELLAETKVNNENAKTLLGVVSKVVPTLM